MELRRQDLLLPADSLIDHEVFYIHLRNPKTARFARRQHCKVDDPIVLTYVIKVFGDPQPPEALLAGGASAFRRRWNEVMSRLGIPVGSRAGGVTPAVLRGSGATYQYLLHEDLSRVQWRGRWSQLRTVEHYVQEVGAQTIVARLDPLSRSRIKELSDASFSLLQMFFSGQLAVPKD